jgi:hypothetical protein
MSTRYGPLTSKSMTMSQVKNWLLNFNFLHVTAIIDHAIAEGSFINVYGTGVTVRYVKDGNRWYIALNDFRR